MQATGKKDLDALIRITDAGMHHPEVPPFRSAMPGFFEQLPCGGIADVLTGIDLSRRQFEERATQRIAKLSYEQQSAVVEKRDDHHRSLVPHVLTQALLAVGQLHAVAPDVEELAAEDLGALQLLFAEMRVIVFQSWTPNENAPAGGAFLSNSLRSQSDRRSVKAQSDIKACGKIPSKATARPLADIRILTSSGACIAEVFVG